MTPLIPISGFLTPSLVTTYLLLCVLAASGMFVVAVDLWRSRATRAGRLALAVVGCVLGWLLAVLLALLSPTAPQALFWHATVRFVFVVALAPLVILYLACYFGVPRFSRGLVVGLGLIPGLTILFALTNGLHHLFLAAYTMQRVGPYFVRAAWAPGPWFPIYGVFTVLSMLGACVALVWVYRRRASLYRRQAWVVTLAVVAPAALFAFDTVSRSPLALLGLTPLGFAVTALLLTWGLRHERVLDLVPVAHEAIFAGMTDPVLILDARERVIDLNPAAEEALGCAVDRAVGVEIDTLLPRRLAELQVTGSDNGRGGISTSLDLAHDGQTRSYDIRLSSFGLRAGRIDGRVLVLRDITDLKQAEQRLAEQASQVEAIFEAMSEGVALFDQYAHIVRVNQAWKDMFRLVADIQGLSADPEFVALPFVDQVERLGQVRPIDTDGRVIPFEDIPSVRALRGETVTGANAVDQRVQSPDGRVFVASVSAAPVRDSAGHITGVVAVSRDVTTHRQLERQVAEQASQLTAIFEAIADGIAVYDPQGRFVRANRAMEQMYGFTADSEFTVLPLAERAQRLQIYDEHGQRLLAEQWPHWRVLNGADLMSQRTLDTHVVTLDGREMWVSTTGAPIHGPDGETAGVVLVNRDVTARRQLEQDMMQRAREVTAVFEAIAEGISIYDAKGRITEYNRAFQDLLGIHADPAYLSRSYPRRVGTLRPRGSDGQPIVYEQMLLTRALQGEVIQADDAPDTSITTPDGRERTLSRSAVPIRDAQGQIVGATIVHRDVTRHRHLERQVQEQADQLAAIFEAQADGVGVFDCQRRLVRANRAWQAILEQYADVTGLSADPAFTALPLANQVDRLVLHDERGHVIPREERPTARALRGETMTGASAIDEWVHGPTGPAVVLNVSAAPVLDGAGQITGAVTIVRDVTSRRQLARQLAEQERQFRTLVENLPDYVTRHDPLLRMLYANPRAEAAMGIPLAARKGKTFADLGLPEALYAPWESAIRKVFATGEPYEFDVTSPFGDGAAAAQTYHYRMRYIPEFAADGAVASVLGIASDVTALQQTEARLAEQAGQLEAIFGAMADGVLVVDREGQVVRTNRAWQEMFRQFADVSGLSSMPDFAALPLSEQIDRWAEWERLNQSLPKDANGHEIPHEELPTYRALRGETITGANAADERYEAPDGRVFETSDSAAPVRDAAGNITGAVTVARDVTAHRQLERRLQAHIAQAATEAERARLARELHDTVTQELYAASLMAEALPRVWTQHPAEAERALGHLHEITKSGLATMRLLLVELRSDGLEEMTLLTLVQLLLNAMQTRAGMPLRLDIAGDEDSWSWVPQEVKQAFYRMAQEGVTNAVKYASASQIAVRLRQGRRGSLHLEVEDDGVGFDTHTTAPGHFGLQMMRERAKAVGATVRIESHAGQGTRVVIHRKGTERGQEETSAVHGRQRNQQEKGAVGE